MDKFADNQPDLKPLHDAKSLCEEFARLKRYTLKMYTVPIGYSRRLYFIRIRYGKYSLKYFDGPWSQTQNDAYAGLAKRLCNPDQWFNPHHFKGWSHFGKCSCTEELAMRMAIYGDSKI